MRIAAIITLLCGLVLVNGCGKDAAKQISSRYDAALATYHAADVRAAESALVSFREFLAQERSSDPNVVDYDELEGIVDLRLFSLYDYLGNRSKATEALNRSSVLLRGRLKSTASDSQREQQLKELLQALEREAPPLWKNMK